MQIHSKSTCSSPSITDDQKDDSFVTSGNDGCVKNDSLLDNTVTILEADESLTNINNKEQRHNMGQSISDEKCDNPSAIEVLSW